MHRTCLDRVLQTKFPLKKLTGSSIVLNFKKLSPGHSLSWQNSIHVGSAHTKLMKDHSINDDLFGDRGCLGKSECARRIPLSNRNGPLGPSFWLGRDRLATK